MRTRGRVPPRWEAWVDQVLNVSILSFGDTRDERRGAIKEALDLYLEDAPDSYVNQVANV